MTNTPKEDETKFNETLKRMLETPPKPHAGQKPAPAAKEGKKADAKRSERKR